MRPSILSKFSVLLKYGGAFPRAVVALFLVVFIHSALIFVSIDLPIVLLYPAMLMSAHLALKTQNDGDKTIIMSYLLLFVSYSFIYVYIRWILRDGEEWLKSYYLLYYSTATVTLLLTAIRVLWQTDRWRKPIKHMESALMQQLCVLSIMVAVLIGAVLIEMFFPNFMLDIHPRFILYALMALGAFLKLRYIYQALSTEIMYSDTLSTPNKCKLSKSFVEDCKVKITACMEKDKLYLWNNLSMEILAQESGISKHHLSEFFNSCLHTSFYNFVAEYRIEYALDVLKQNSDTFSIEGLAYECGFNSKTTFNKYFKEITGCSLSEYREKIKTVCF